MLNEWMAWVHSWAGLVSGLVDTDGLANTESWGFWIVQGRTQASLRYGAPGGGGQLVHLASESRGGVRFNAWGGVLAALRKSVSGQGPRIAPFGNSNGSTSGDESVERGVSAA